MLSLSSLKCEKNLLCFAMNIKAKLKILSLITDLATVRNIPRGPTFKRGNPLGNLDTNIG